MLFTGGMVYGLSAFLQDAMTTAKPKPPSRRGHFWCVPIYAYTLFEDAVYTHLRTLGIGRWPLALGAL